MKLKFRKSLLRLLRMTNIFFVVLSIIVIISYWSDSNWLGALAIVGFLTPFLVVAHLFFVLLWFWLKRGWVWLSATILVLSFLSFGWFYKISDEKSPKIPNLSVMSYNARGFNMFEQISVDRVDEKITDFIKVENPDILCLQEHARIQYQRLRQYPYRSETPYEQRKSTQAIFSKYPIVNKGSLDLKGTTNNIIFADIALPNDTIRVYNVHFQSFKIVVSEEHLRQEKTVRLTKRISNTLSQQGNQARVLREHMKQSPYKLLVCGDFNATQFSNAYRIAANGMQDSFMKMGKKWGRTFSLKGIPLRIDYILADDAFEVVSHKNYNMAYSDHYPIMAALFLKPNK